jgi:alanine dehydrogenase
MENCGLLMISRSDVTANMTMNDYMAAVENAMTLHGRGDVLTPDLLHVDADGGEFHVKVGGLRGGRTYFGLKANGGFFGNRSTFGLPNIWGIIYLSDGSNGRPLAIVESTEISINRTAAASALAATRLANPTSNSVTIVGTGTQAFAQLRFISSCFSLSKVFIFGRDESKATAFAADASEQLSLDVVATSNLEAACAASDIIVTCTTSREHLIPERYVKPGTFIAAVGADSPGKQELDPRLFINAKVVCDVKSQCLVVGELQHAIQQTLISPEQVYAELGEILTGSLPGREDSDEIIIYDSTGTALQDIACAAVMYEKLSDSNAGNRFKLFS